MELNGEGLAFFVGLGVDPNGKGLAPFVGLGVDTKGEGLALFVGLSVGTGVLGVGVFGNGLGGTLTQLHSQSHIKPLIVNPGKPSPSARWSNRSLPGISSNSINSPSI